MKPVQDDNKFLSSSRRAHVYQEWAFWANLFWTLPAVLYMSADIIYFTTAGNERLSGYFRLFASISTMIDWVFFMLDWKQGNEDETRIRKNALQEAGMDRLLTCMVKTDWYLHSNMTFLSAALAYLTQAIFDLWYPDVDESLYFFVDIMCTHSWLISAFQALAGWHVKRVSQRRLQCNVQYAMIKGSCIPWPEDDKLRYRRSPISVRIDWSGWGDWVFLLSSSIFVLNTHLNYLAFEERRAVAIDLLGCFWDLTNSLLYFYAFFLFYYHPVPGTEHSNSMDYVLLTEISSDDETVSIDVR